ncbi:MAG TPA: HAD hydrolase-like protein [Caulobacter sp.]|nr:HAD hydrolase-like protein [Caulobacter sp.]
MPAYRLAIFDFDGTLGDTLGWMLDTSDALAEKFGYRKIDRSQLDQLRHLSAREMMKVQKLPAVKLPAIAAHFQKLMTADAGRIAMFDGVPEMLRALHGAGVRLAIVSSNSEENVRIILGPDLCGLVSMFNCGASMFGKAPKFRKVLKRLEVRPGEAISVGDEIRDLDAAREVGLATGVVCWGYTAPDALKAQKPDHVFETVEAIAARLS